MRLFIHHIPPQRGESLAWLPAGVNCVLQDHVPRPFNHIPMPSIVPRGPAGLSRGDKEILVVPVQRHRGPEEETLLWSVRLGSFVAAKSSTIM